MSELVARYQNASTAASNQYMLATAHTTPVSSNVANLFRISHSRAGWLKSKKAVKTMTPDSTGALEPVINILPVKTTSAPISITNHSLLSFETSMENNSAWQNVKYAV